MYLCIVVPLPPPPTAIATPSFFAGPEGGGMVGGSTVLIKADFKTKPETVVSVSIT